MFLVYLSRSPCLGNASVMAAVRLKIKKYDDGFYKTWPKSGTQDRRNPLRFGADPKRIVSHCYTEHWPWQRIVPSSSKCNEVWRKKKVIFLIFHSNTNYIPFTAWGMFLPFKNREGGAALKSDKWGLHSSRLICLVAIHQNQTGG